MKRHHKVTQNVSFWLNMNESRRNLTRFAISQKSDDFSKVSLFFCFVSTILCFHFLQNFLFLPLLFLLSFVFHSFSNLYPLPTSRPFLLLLRSSLFFFFFFLFFFSPPPTISIAPFLATSCSFVFGIPAGFSDGVFRGIKTIEKRQKRGFFSAFSFKPFS